MDHCLGRQRIRLARLRSSQNRDSRPLRLRLLPPRLLRPGQDGLPHFLATVRQAVCILGPRADHGQLQPAALGPSPARAGILRPPPHRGATHGPERIDAVRGLLKTKRAAGRMEERRKRIEEVCAVWPVAGDVELGTVDVRRPQGRVVDRSGSNSSRCCSSSTAGLLLGFDREPSPDGGRGGADGGVQGRLPSSTGSPPSAPFPRRYDDALKAWRSFAGRDSDRPDRRSAEQRRRGAAAALVARLRAETGKAPASAWLVSPWTDLTMSEATMTTKDAVDPLIHEGYLEELAAAYAPAGIDKKGPARLAALRRSARFPPTLIQVGSAETLLDDATRFAAAAGAADVAVTLEVWPRMIHAFPIWNTRLEPARRALMHASEFMRRSGATRQNGGSELLRVFKAMSVSCSVMRFSWSSRFHDPRQSMTSFP